MRDTSDLKMRRKKEADLHRLIREAQEGNRDAFEDIVTRYYTDIYKIAFSWCPDRQDAQDIAQNACIKLVKALEGFRGDAAFSSWLYRLVINVARDYVRGQTRFSGHIDIEDLAPANPEPDAEKQLQARQMLARIHDLPGGERDALLLVFHQGLSHARAADILECAESTISWRIHEARKKLKSMSAAQTQGSGD